MRTYWQMRMDHARLGPPAFLRGLGADPGQMDPGQQAVFEETGIYPDQSMAVETANQLAQYTSDQIIQAFTWLKTACDTAVQNLQDMNDWFNANKGALTQEDFQSYQANIDDETGIVQQLQGWVNQAQSYINSFGIQSSGMRGLGSLGIAPAVVVVIVAAIIGVSAVAITALVSHEQNIQEQTKQLQLKASQNLDDLLSHKLITQEQWAAAKKQLADSSKQSWVDQIPWKTGLVIGGIVLVARAVFG